MGDAEKWGVILTDYDHDVTAYLVSDKVVWDWAHQNVPFPNGASAVVVQAPAGYQFEDGTVDAAITIGSSDNDLLIYAVELERIGSPTKAVEYLEGVNSAAAAVKKLFAAGVTEANIEEGMVY